MLTLSLALRSLANRRLTSVLTVASIALSVSLLVGVETIRRGVRESFAGTIRGTDLIVAPRGSSQQILMSTIFGLGAPPGALSWSSYQRYAEHPAVGWTIPIMLGDSYYGYRVLGTTDAFFEHYRFRNDGRATLAAGAFPELDHDLVVGAEVADQRGLSLGSELAITHGLRGTGIMDHVEHPFRVVGILAPTFTPIDRTLFVTMEGIEAMHEGFEQGGGGVPPPEPSSGAADAATAGGHDDHGHLLSAFLVGTRNRVETMQLKREIDTDSVEALSAVMPAVALTELWHSIGFAEDGARLISFAVLLVGLLGMLVSLYSTLQERRREMAILRSLGAGPGRIAALLVFESGLLSALGAVAGVLLVYGVLLVGGGIAERHFGLFIPITAPGRLEWLYLGGVVVAGVLVGLVPAWRAYRNTLQDGLTIRL
ncbi:MAG: FtsX-like permease family protein [Gemmatimonadales bacterium]|nr:FtsX-like permease family protein [Gemmatimonadales bacterium]MDZ4388976.1 FtsX-like permease family protein [Gemmatimonadales bacterium]